MKSKINKYIELIVKKGINIQDNQPVYINASVENHDFVIELTKKLYESGSNDVYVNWSSTELSRLNFEYKSIETLSSVDSWLIERYKTYVEKDAAFISISSSDPEGLKGIDNEKISTASKANSKAIEKYRKRIMNDENSWCVVSIPSEKWAKKVFPNSDDSVNDLWDAILKVTRCDEAESAIKLWDKHLEKLKHVSSELNKYNFNSLKFTNNKGTNLEVGLVENHIWVSGESDNKVLKNTFVANMPTEEVFTMPNKNMVNGKVVSTKPLNYNGQLIEEFWIEFSEGKAIDWDAKKNKDVLTKLITTDEGSAYLGEVALVECDNPIAKLDILFYNTLFDENASCHLAFGQSYPTNITTENHSKEEKESIGINESLVHEDFMFGDETMKVIGIKDNEEVIIMENGKFTI